MISCQPWDISESAYNARDLELTYQYSNFGVPGLGLNRDLGENRVIAPYATALASMVDPRAAVANLERLTEIGAQGRYGFYEALDYTPARVPEGQSVAIVHVMAHHQGMTIVAIADALLDGPMRARFHAEPIIKATELLLQKRMPRDVKATRLWAADVKSAAGAHNVEPSGGRRFDSAQQATPATHLLSNGRYSTMLSRWGDLVLTRWREDATCDDSGFYIYVKDLRTGVAWPAGFQPSGVEPDSYAVVFDEDRAEITRSDSSLTTTLDIIVRGRRRSAPGIDHEFWKPPARHRDDVPPRTRPLPALSCPRTGRRKWPIAFRRC
jgi:cyclic beta-1,2-glucan synthetase